MKYRVVGWASYDDSGIEDSKGSIGYAERNAIIDEIRKNGYLFSGWDHQESWDNCAPILNDGKRRCFSQRGWGGVMAEAYGYNEPYDYARFTFYESINPEKRNVPKGWFNPKKFTPEKNLSERFEVEVREEIYLQAQECNPFVLDDMDELRYLDGTDTLVLKCGTKSATYAVTDVDRSVCEEGEPLVSTRVKLIVTCKGSTIEKL